MSERSKAVSGLRRPVTVVALVASFVGLSIGFTTAPALGGSAVGSWGTFSTGSANFKNQASIYTATGLARASTATYNAVSGNLPAGWLGAQGRLFKDGDANPTMIGTWSYNPGPSNGITGLSGDSGGYFNWYSYGVSRGWNVTGYQNVYTFVSPFQHS